MCVQIAKEKDIGRESVENGTIAKSVTEAASAEGPVWSRNSELKIRQNFTEI